MMIRRFVNLVAENGCSGMYSLHRLDVSNHLFYPSIAAADAANKKNNGDISDFPVLPDPLMRFNPSPTGPLCHTTGKLERFSLLSPRRSEHKILCSNRAGHTVLFHADSQSIEFMPRLNGDKWSMPTAISIARPDAAAEEEEEEEELYIINSVPNRGDTPSCFDVLSSRCQWHKSHKNCGALLCLKNWSCDALPPPPLHDYVCSHAVVGGGRTICVSTVPGCGGTCYSDTMEREWRPAAAGGG